MDKSKKLRVLGKGLTAQAIKDTFPNSTLYDDTDFSKYDISSNELTIVSPGIPPSNDMVKKSQNLLSDYDLFDEVMPFSIWISGTNGKTTTTQMCQHLLKEYGSECGGNIGTPICNLNLNSPIWILETSSFTLHYTNRAKPNLYILLPISEDHITWHGGFKEYRESKLKPLSLMKEGEIAIIPEEFKDYPTNAYKITYKNSDDLCNIFDIEKNEIKFNEPFLLDAILALATKKILFDDVDYTNINTFKIDKHKVEEFNDLNNRLWVNDSKATNIDATINALIPYEDKKIHLILGGDDKGANLIPLFEKLKNLDVNLYLIGKNEKRLLELSKKYHIKSISCSTLSIAVNEIDKYLEKDLSVGILSPAAASLDQFKSYSHRGDEFMKMVKNLS